MRASRAVAALATMLAFVCAAGLARAAGPAPVVELPAFAPVVSVAGNVVVVGRGEAQGFAPRGALLTGWPREPLVAGTRPPRPLALEGLGGVALRVARVDAAQASLEPAPGAAAPSALRAGDAVQWTLRVPAPLADDPLVRAAALGVELTTLEDGRSLLALEGLAQPPGARRDKVRQKLVAQMLGELRSAAQFAEVLVPRPVSAGRFKGMQLGAVFRESGAADLDAFFAYLADRPAVYAAARWKLAELYAGWATTGAPAGLPRTRRAEVAPLLASAKQALARGDWEAAERAFVRVLGDDADNPEASAGRTALATLARAEAALAIDPASRASAWLRARAWADLGRHDLALAAFDGFVQSGYRVNEARRQRAFAWVGLARFGEAEAEVAALTAEAGAGARDDRELARLQAAVRARGAGGAAGELAVARAFEADEAWDSALGAYAEVLDASASSEVEREAARAGIGRVYARDELAQAEQQFAALVRGHDLVTARALLERVLGGYRTLDARQAESRALARCAQAGGAVREFGLALDCARERGERFPDDPDALADLGAELVRSGRVEEGFRAFDRAVKRDALSPHVRRARSVALLALGRANDARAAAALGSGSDAETGSVYARAGYLTARRDDALAASLRAAELDPAPIYGLRADAMRRLLAVDGELAASAPDEPKLAHARKLLRRVRALAVLGFGDEAYAALGAIDAPAAEAAPVAHEAAWAIAEASEVPLPIRLAAARQAAPTTVAAQRTRARLEAETAFLAHPEQSALRHAFVAAAAVDGDFDAAAAAFGPLTRVSSDPLARAILAGLDGDAHAAQARAANARGDANDAASAWAEAALRYTTAGAPGRVVDAQLAEASAWLEAGRHAEAEKLLAPLRQAATDDGRARAIAEVELLTARIEALSGDLGPLVATLERQVAGAREREDSDVEARAEQELAQLALDRGRSGDALSAIQRARELWLGLARKEDARRTALREARLRRMRGELARGAELAGEVFREGLAAGSPLTGQAALELGVVALRRDDAAAARRWLARARDQAERRDDRELDAQASLWLGRVEAADRQGDRARAEDELARAEAAFEAAGLPAWALEAAIDRAEVQAGRKPSRKAALERLPTLLAKATTLGRAVLALRAALALGEAELGLGALDRADPRLTEAQARAAAMDLDDLKARAAYDLARLRLAQGQKDVAADLFLAAGRLEARPSAAVFAEGAQLLFELGRHEDALDLLGYQQALETRRGFDATRLRTSDPALQANLNGISSALAEAESARELRREDADRPPAERDPEHSADLAKLEAKNAAELGALLLKLSQTHQALYAQLSIDPQSLRARRAAIPPDAVLVQYWLTDDELRLIILRRDPGGVHARRVDVPAARLTESARRYRQLVRTGGALADDLARQLYDWLLRPLEAEVPYEQRAQTTLVLLPQGPLQRIPFGALISSPPGAPVRHALETWRLAIASPVSLEPVLQAARAHITAPEILALADPQGDLAGAASELADTPHVTLLAGADASKAQLAERVARFPIVHFATHGNLTADAMSSYLELADGHLSVDDIAGSAELGKSARLVVLSACQSASDIGPDDGELVSLTNAFATAGVPSVIGTLWDIDDRATSALITSFYRALDDGHHDLASALRDAQLAVRDLVQDGQRPFADPRFWAAFVLVGDYRW